MSNHTKAQELQSGDSIDLTPIFEEFGSDFDAETDVSMFEYAVVESVSIERAAVNGEDGVYITTDQHNVLVPVNYEIEVQA